MIHRKFYPREKLIGAGRLTTLAVLVVVLGGTLALLALGSRLIVLDSFTELERQKTDYQLDQVGAFLGNELEQLGRTAGDYGGWDEAYRFVQDGNRRFVDVNLDDAIFPQLRLNILLFLDTAGKIRYAKAFDYRKAKEIPFPAVLKAHLHPASPLLHHASTKSRTTGIISLPEGFLLTASQPILKSDYSGPIKGTLILGRFLDPEELERIAGILQLPLTVFRSDAANLPADVSAALPVLRTGSGHTEIFDRRTLAGYALFTDVFGNEAFVLKIDGERSIYRQGLQANRYFLLWTAVICFASGAVVFILIDRLKRGKRRLQQAHNLLEGIIGSSEDMIVALGADFRLLIFNRAFEEEYRRIFGAEVQSGDSLINILAHVPHNRQKELDLWRRALAGEAFTFLGEFGDPDRAQRIFEMDFTPLRDAQGEVAAAACIARDVTIRLREERALRESEQRFRVFFNNVAVGTIQLDAEGHFVRVNDRCCWMTGYRREELLQMTPEDLVHPDDRRKDRKPFWKFLHGEASAYRAEKRWIRKDGEVIWIEMAAGLVQDAQGHYLRTVGIVQDISDRKRLEEELHTAKCVAEEANRAKSEFLATMSHEIRTPMTVFMVALEHLLEIDNDPERRQFLEMSDAAVRRLHILIDDILDFSRIEAGRFEIDQQSFALRQCIDRVVALLSVSAQDKGLRLEVEVAPDVPQMLTGDPDRIEQILINLVGNAIKFTEKGGVNVSVQLRDAAVHFLVSDTGIGIPEEKNNLLFRHFSQVDSSSTRKYGGTGLGLAICKGLVDMMGGKIGYRKREGGGSVFFFTLPLESCLSGYCDDRRSQAAQGE